MSDHQAPQAISVIKSAFDWFNRTSAEGGAILESDVRRHWTDDAVMIANNRIKCSGIAAHIKHFNDLLEQMKFTEIQPFDIVVDGPDRAAAYYRINFKSASGEEGTIYDLAIWDVRDGKIARMTEIIHVEGAQVALQDF